MAFPAQMKSQTGGQCSCSQLVAKALPWLLGLQGQSPPPHPSPARGTLGPDSQLLVGPRPVVPSSHVCAREEGSLPSCKKEKEQKQ